MPQLEQQIWMQMKTKHSIMLTFTSVNILEKLQVEYICASRNPQFMHIIHLRRLCFHQYPDFTDLWSQKGSWKSRRPTPSFNMYDESSKRFSHNLRLLTRLDFRKSKSWREMGGEQVSHCTLTIWMPNDSIWDQGPSQTKFTGHLTFWYFHKQNWIENWNICPNCFG